MGGTDRARDPGQQGVPRAPEPALCAARVDAGAIRSQGRFSSRRESRGRRQRLPGRDRLRPLRRAHTDRAGDGRAVPSAAEPVAAGIRRLRGLAGRGHVSKGLGAAARRPGAGRQRDRARAPVGGASRSARLLCLPRGEETAIHRTRLALLPRRAAAAGVHAARAADRWWGGGGEVRVRRRVRPPEPERPHHRVSLLPIGHSAHARARSIRAQHRSDDCQPDPRVCRCDRLVERGGRAEPREIRRFSRERAGARRHRRAAHADAAGECARRRGRRARRSAHDGADARPVISHHRRFC